MRIGVKTGIIIVVIVGSLLITIPNVSADLPENIDNGPYIDNAVYKVIQNGDMRRLALLAGEIDMDSVSIKPYYEDPSYLAELAADPDIDIAQTMRNGYYYANFDCEQYPVNISGFRRAFAYAFNKTKVVIDVLNGYAQVHDSVVPYQNQFCVEDEFGYQYYDARPDIGNNILDNLGFAINSSTGFRDAPNGEPVHILIVYGGGFERFNRIADICIEAFTSLNINASSTAPCNCDLHEEMTIWAQTFYGQDLSWLAYQYWSKCPDDYYYSTGYRDTGFSNSSYDSWRDQFLHSPSYEGTYEAASQMQKILHYNVPLIPICQDIFLNPYRNDRFTGYILDSVNSVYGPWTMLNLNKLDGTYGGTVSIGMFDDPLFNFWMTGATSGNWFLSNLYTALYTRDPDQQPYPRLAESVIIETHSDNPSVSDGNTRFTFEIVNDSIWTDGVPVTSDDVLFTFNYILESRDFGNPAGSDLSGLVALYSPRPGIVVLEFSIESYWLFDRIAYDFIVPKHVFENYGPEEWADWNLITINNGDSLNCGPFVLTDYEESEFYELTWNRLWIHRYWRELIYLEITSILPSDDIEIDYPFFTISWDIKRRDILDGYLSSQSEGFNLNAVLEQIPFSYTVLLDGHVYFEGSWSSTDDRLDTIDIYFAVPMLARGQHNVTLLLDNNHDSIQTDTVIVTINYPYSPLIVIGGMIIVVFIILLWTIKLRHSQPLHLGS